MNINSIIAAVLSIPRRTALLTIRLYQFVFSPMLTAMFGRACRFEPTCSEYAASAISNHGVIRGGAMAIVRFARCNPFGGHGHDPVPMRGRT
jgi:uncharacterized protein